MRVLLLLMLSLPAWGSWGNSCTFRRSITVDHTKVPNTDQVNFPIAVAGTYTFLKTVANGGDVTNSSGFDIVFASDANGASPLNWETVGWSGSTGTVEYWVRISSLSHSSDTIFYLFYGCSGITTDQSHKTATWDANFAGVYHLPDGTTLNMNDSTSNGRNGTGSTTPNAIAAQIDGGADDSGSNKVLCGSNGNFDFGVNGSFTLSVWVKTTQTGTKVVVGNIGSNNYWLGISGGKASFTAGNSATEGTATVNDGNWHLLTGVHDGPGTATKVYVDGVQKATANTTANGDTGSQLALGSFGSTGGFTWIGSFDEAHISNSVRSADWLLTEFNNQNSPSTFYTVGAAVTNSSSVAHRAVSQ